MGMDVYGKNPTSKEGEYFRASIWSWPAVWDTAVLASPTVAAKVTYAYSNGGDGLEAEDATKLGQDMLDYIGATGQEEFHSFPDENHYANQFARAIGIRPDFNTDDDMIERFARFAIASGGFAIH